MKTTQTVALIACTLMAAGAANISAAFAGNDAMMMKPDTMMMEKKDAMMEVSTSMKKMEMATEAHEAAFTPEAFSMAQAHNQPFLVAFHKKGCPLCASQKQALNEIYANPEYKDLKVLVVDYDNDTTSLQKFNVGMQGTLILYQGQNEVSRSNALTKASDIAKQIQG